ncbi:coiled-coil domain-containing protein 170 isoform X5 [Canis lupus familiaris]|uniref:coiled-coil domain-containing protein 170 isoform X4 n=1 Tax=Canis lupus dingo TaxID=286419 RepID=UPI0006B3E47F|nr:coiled-coil domain-containing protein 170 isoform X4 [Canis lupus dingo]XP_038372228.1 coiled-coil domain-containing protein 170 isoform X5 [Canis lupus familiaris]XP_038510384.1 coiled-coil domain-containing protein 170 isoform X5 [Canis lupus familiaris]
MFETFALQRMLCLSYFAQLHRKDCLKLFFAFCLLGEPCQEIYDHLLEVPVSRDQLNHYRNVAEDARSELAATLVKFECAQSELRDLRSKLLSKEAFCQELKAEMENYKENNARKSSLLTSLRDRVQELEEESAALTASKIRTEITAHTAIKENQELKKKVAELDESFQKCLKEIEENKNQVSKNCRQHEEFLAQLGDCLDPDKKNEKASYEDLILKLRELCEENAFVKGQIVTLEETINVHEMEAKASRETIMRLVSEVNRAQEKAASCTKEKGKLNQDLLSAVETKEALEMEVRILQERLLAGQQVWDASKQELNLLKKRSCELEKSLEASVDAAAASRSQYFSFREKVAALLRGSWGTTGPKEDAIVERIREMTSQEESRKKMVSQLEARISELVEQLGNESGFHQKALQRAQKAENKLEVLQGQLTHLEGELVSGDVLRDNLNFEKQKYLKFLDQLSEKMKLDQMAAELGFDMRLDVVLARTEQLVRLESNAVIENKTLAYNLQRKIKTLEQTKAIEDLNKSRDKLEKMKEKAEKKLTSVKSELDTTEREAQEDKERAKNMIEVVTNEMKTLKKSLEEVERREKQLVDFREVISKMLGLNMTSLALPDYEIIRCLERLIHSHQHYFVTCACLQDVPPRGERHTQSHLKLLH